MFETSSPTAWRRWLTFRLREMRAARDLTQAQASKACGWSGARLSYIENAQQNVTEADLEKLLALYEVDEEEWAVYFDAAAKSQAKGWWERYDQRELPNWLSLYVGLEQGAASLQAYETNVIHGLLQTKEYAAALVRTGLVRRTDRQVERLVDLRIRRQSALTRESPLDLHVVLDEATLHRLCSRRDVAAGQLRHLVTVAQRPNVTLQVLPFDAGAESNISGSFTILGFPWPADPGVAYVEYRSGAIYLDSPHEVDAHTLLFQHVCSLALDQDASIERIERTAEEITSG